jgi:secreted PhoX family phosphatase
MMAVTRQPGYLTARNQEMGMTVPVHWVDLDDPDPPEAEVEPLALFREGLSKGGAIFARLEGAFAADGGIYVVSTNGGEALSGQVFHYRPTSEDRGELTTVFESPSPEVLQNPDNMVVSRRGGLIMCEDSVGTEFIRGLDREGSVIDLVRATQHEGQAEPGEFAGACFSPDGRVLFFNVQGDRTADGAVASTTYAFWGPWENGPL